jgi:glyceraldehyde-3-phosphate dehydrogenase (ferredoxin)
MTHNLKALILDAATGFYTIKTLSLGRVLWPGGSGLAFGRQAQCHQYGRGDFRRLDHTWLKPAGRNRLFPFLGGFYVSSMGGAGLVFDDLGINLLSIIGKSAQPSVLILNRQHGEEIEVSLEPLPVTKIWDEGEKGVYAMLEHVHTHYSHLYEYTPRILAVGPAARYADCGGIVSAPIRNGKLTDVDTWAGRGGMGSKLYQQHGICAVIYGGTHIDEDFRDSKVADEWFQARYEQKMMAKDLEATKKYRLILILIPAALSE